MSLLLYGRIIKWLMISSIVFLVSCGAETKFDDSESSSSPDSVDADNPPESPSQLRGTRQGDQVVLTWSDNSSNESNFLVEVMIEGGSWSEVIQTDPNAIVARLNLSANTTLGFSTDDIVYIRVTALNNAGSSGYSNIIRLENETAPENDLITQGALLWVERDCQGCHEGDDEVADFKVRSALNSNTFIHKTRDTMPPANISSCDEACAQAIAAWLGSVYADVDEEDSEDVTVIEQPAVPASEAALLKRLHKVTHSLGHLEPSQEWIDLVRTQGEAGLETVTREVLELPGFYWRVREIYAPVLQSHVIPSNDYAKMINGRAAWYNDLPPEQIGDAGRTRWAIWDAINNEPSRLIEYVIKNDLPFTEILTADYTLVNYFSARAYNVLDQVNFTETDTPSIASFPYDEGEYQKAYLPFPGSGILTSSVFMTIYPTSAGNKNRHRAYTVYKLFLDTDILDLPGSRVDEDDITVANPTMENPTCTGCHNVMDPVASAFRHWADGEVRHGNWRFSSWYQDDILPPGFNGKVMPEDNEGAVQWLGKEIVKDPRFAMSTVKTFFKEITGHELLPAPNANDSANTKALYEYQQNQLQIFADNFVQSGYLVKDLVVDLVLSDYFGNEAYLGGTSRLLTNIQLDRKVRSVLGVDWFGVSNDLVNRFYRGDQPSGIMTLMQQMAGSEVACYAVPADFYKPIEERRLLPFFIDGPVVDTEGNVISSEKETEIKKNLQNLMWVIWGRAVELDSPDLLSLYDLYLEVIPIGLQNNTERGTSWYDYYCDRHNRMRGFDDHYALSAWMAIVNLMVDDHRFFYN